MQLILSLFVIGLAIAMYGFVIVAACRSVEPTLELTENDIVPEEQRDLVSDRTESN